MAEAPLPENLATLSPNELLRLREEICISREVRKRQGQQYRIPYLPTFSGDSTGVDFTHFQSAITSVQANYDDNTIIQAIRKSTSGQAAKVLASLDYSTSKFDIIKVLETNFGHITDSATSWANFYAATQQHKESLVEWRTRLFILYQKTGNTENTDLHMKTRLYQGLKDQKLKEQALFKFDDAAITESELLQFLRKIVQNQRHSSGASANVIQADDKISKLEAQVASLTEKLKCMSTSEKPKKKEHPRNKLESSDNKQGGSLTGYQSNNQRYEGYNGDYHDRGHNRGYNDRSHNRGYTNRGNNNNPDNYHNRGDYQKNFNYVQKDYRRYDDRRCNGTYKRNAYSNRSPSPRSFGYQRSFNNRYESPYRHRDYNRYNRHDDRSLSPRSLRSPRYRSPDPRYASPYRQKDPYHKKEVKNVESQQSDPTTKQLN